MNVVLVLELTYLISTFLFFSKGTFSARYIVLSLFGDSENPAAAANRTPHAIMY